MCWPSIEAIRSTQSSASPAGLLAYEPLLEKLPWRQLAIARIQHHDHEEVRVQIVDVGGDVAREICLFEKSICHRRATIPTSVES